MAFEVPTIGGPNTTQDPKIKTAVEGLNGVAGQYRLLFSGQQPLGNDLAAGTYAFQRVETPTASGGLISLKSVPFFGFGSADASVSGTTQKLRLRVQALTNATKPTIKFTVGLYPFTVAGAADAMNLTLGTVVSGSTVEINEPAASTVTSAVGSDFTIPSDGAYVLGVVTSATLTNNASVILSAQLQTRSV